MGAKHQTPNNAAMPDPRAYYAPPRPRRKHRWMQQMSILMTLTVAGMGAIWYGLESGAFDDDPSGVKLAGADDGAKPVSLQAKADKSLLDQGD